MNPELIPVIPHILRLMGASAQDFPDEVIAETVRLNEDGLSPKTLIEVIIAIKKEKNLARALKGQEPVTATLCDLRSIRRRLGMDAQTPENRALWRKKFEEGRAKHLCPNCGYAGNQEFEGGFADFRYCPVCYRTAYYRYFDPKLSLIHI